MKELLKQLQETQLLMDRTLTDIGHKFAMYTLTKDEKLTPLLNDKVRLYQKLEVLMNEIEQSINNFKE